MFIPECRGKALQGEPRRHLGEAFKRLAARKESRIGEGRLTPGHMRMMIAIPPKHAASQIAGFVKGESAIHPARVHAERRRDFVGRHFWARGYFVSTAGREEEVIREYIRDREVEDAGRKPRGRL